MNHVRDVGRIRSVRISVLGRFILNESKGKKGARKRSSITFEDSRRQRCQHLGNTEWSLSPKGWFIWKVLTDALLFVIFLGVVSKLHKENLNLQETLNLMINLSDSCHFYLNYSFWCSNRQAVSELCQGRSIWVRCSEEASTELLMPTWAVITSLW